MALRQVRNNQQPFTLGDRKFQGIDTYNDPSRVDAGFCQNAENLFIYGGIIRPRNGWASVWYNTSGTPSYNFALANPVRELTVLRDAGQTSRLVFASGTSLYTYDTAQYVNSGTRYTASNQPVILNDRLTGSPINITNADNVRMVQYGRYVYGCSGNTNPLFRVRMNGSTVEAETLPDLSASQLANVKPVATASTLQVMTGTQISAKYTTPILTSGFSNLPSSLFSNLVGDPSFELNVNSGFNRWNYNATDVQNITSGATNKFSTTAKNPMGFISTRDGSTGKRCLKVDQIQDYFYQDIDVRSVNVTYDSEPYTYSVAGGALTQVVTSTPHGLALGQKLQFTAALGGVSTSTIYYVKSIVNVTTFTMTSDSTLVAAAFAFSSAVTTGQFNVLKNVGTYVFTCYLWNEDDLTNFVSGNTLDIKIIGFKNTATTAFASTEVIAGAEVYYNARPSAARTSSDWQRFEIFADFREFANLLTGIQIRVSTAFDRGGASFMLVEDTSLYAINSALSISSVQDDPNGLAKLIGTQDNTTFENTSPVESYARYLQNEYIKIDLGANYSFTETESLSIRAYFSEVINTSVPPFSLGFRLNNRTEWTGQCSYDKDKGYLTFQLFPIPQAYRTSVRYLYIKLDYDISELRNNEWCISLGEVTKQGALTPSSKYSYGFTLWRPYTLPSNSTAGVGVSAWSTLPELPSGDGFETPVTQFSADVTITAAVNQVTLKLYSGDLRKISGGNCQYKFALIYRKNVLTGDDRGRLIAIIDLDTGASYADGNKWTGATSLFSDAATNEITFTDQVQDSALLFDNGSGTRGYRFRFGRDPFPTGCDSIASFNGRLFVSKKNTVHASWQLDTSNEYGIYTTLYPDFNDPLLPLKGSTFDISSRTDEEKIVDMLPIGGDGLIRENSSSAALAILRERSAYLLTGDNPAQFASQGYLQGEGTGLLAKRGACIINGRLVYATAGGIMQLMGVQLQPLGLALEGVLNVRSQDFGPSASSNYISAASYANVELCVHDRRIHVLAPIAGEASNATCTRQYVYDTRIDGWVNWINPVAYTSLVSVETADDTQELYAGTRDGRLMRLEGFADKSYGSATQTSTGIPWQFKSRAFGQSAAEGNMYYSDNKIHSLNMHFENTSASNLVINWSLTSMEGYSSTGTYQWSPQKEKVVSIKHIQRTSDKQTFTVTLSGTSSSLWKMFSYHVQTTEGNTPRN